MLNVVLILLLAAPLLVLAAYKFWTWRNGIEPSQRPDHSDSGVSTVHFNYSGHACCTPRSYDIPQDHRAYAKLFVPSRSESE